MLVKSTTVCESSTYLYTSKCSVVAHYWEAVRIEMVCNVRMQYKSMAIKHSRKTDNVRQAKRDMHAAEHSTVCAKQYALYIQPYIHFTFIYCATWQSNTRLERGCGFR